MTDWTLKSAHTIGDRCRIILARTETGPDGTGIEETRTVWHDRTSFNSQLQTLANWKANIKREIGSMLAGLNAAGQQPAPKDITAEVSP